MSHSLDRRCPDTMEAENARQQQEDNKVGGQKPFHSRAEFPGLGSGGGKNEGGRFLVRLRTVSARPERFVYVRWMAIVTGRFMPQTSVGIIIYTDGALRRFRKAGAAPPPRRIPATCCPL